MLHLGSHTYTQPPDNLLYAPLGEHVRDAGDGYTRLEFNLLRKKDAVYFSEELKVAIGLFGYRVMRVHWWIEFRASSDVFRDFLETVARERIAAKQRDDNVASEILKVFMNSLFGKLLQDDRRFTNVAFAFSDNDVLQVVDNEEEVRHSFVTCPTSFWLRWLFWW